VKKNAFLLNTQHLKILDNLYNNNDIIISDLSKKTDISYSHLLNVMNHLESIGVATSIKKGRVVMMTITEKGKESLYFAKELDKILNGGKQNE